MDCASALGVVGGLILSAAYPLLLARILARGNVGISTTSQVLHSVTFLLRYAGVWLEKTPGEHQGSSEWVWLQLYLIPASVLILVSMRYRTGGAQTMSSKQRLVSIIKESVIYITLSFLLAYRVNYGSFSWSDSWISHTTSLDWLSLVVQYFSVEDLLHTNARDASEVMWAASIFLAGVADIPQYVTYYRHVTHKIDRPLMSIMAMISLSPLFYIPLWVARYTETHSFNYIALSGATLQAFSFWMFFVLVVTKMSGGDSDVLEDLEAQLEEYDTSRWGGQALDPSWAQRSNIADGEETKLINISGDNDI